MEQLVEFQECISYGKTKIFDVVDKETGRYIGQIKWSPSFREYSFYANSHTCVNEACMRDIADKLKELMEERKK